MKITFPKLFVACILAGVVVSSWAQDRWVQLQINRGEARLPIYVMPNSKASATLILLPGGDAGTGKIIDDKPGSGNFLSRSRAEFFDADFNVIVVYRATDLKGLDYDYRVGKAHIDELAQAIAYARQTFDKPIWLIGTSRGTVSATAAAIALGDKEVQGLVLTSSVTSKKTGAIATQHLASLKIPTMVVHHKYDACKVCVPHEASRIISDLKSAPAKKFVMVEGGSSPEGDPCEARHWHGFINFEKETVKLITDWIKNPT